MIDIYEAFKEACLELAEEEEIYHLIENINKLSLTSRDAV